MKEKILFVVDEKLKKELIKEAKDNHQTLSSYIRKILYERKK